MDSFIISCIYTTVEKLPRSLNEFTSVFYRSFTCAVLFVKLLLSKHWHVCYPDFPGRFERHSNDVLILKIYIGSLENLLKSVDEVEDERIKQVRCT